MVHSSRSRGGVYFPPKHINQNKKQEAEYGFLGFVPTNKQTNEGMEAQ